MKGGSARVYSKALVEENRKIVEGKTESRGVEQVFPVGGEPGARVQIALTQLTRKRRQQVWQGSTSELLAETNGFNTTSGFFIFWSSVVSPTSLSPRAQVFSLRFSVHHKSRMNTGLGVLMSRLDLELSDRCLKSED